MSDEPVVYVGRMSSACSACNGNADPHESGHYSGGPDSMYAKGSSLSDSNGCGVKWVRRKLVYAYPFDIGEAFNLTDMSEPLYRQFDLEIDSD